ncbi:uncharacterized protein LOC6050873 isoform X2 [Culex quinquefasciatus]|uniref:uncharacterized protein LOC6050873 isoform X2 n=1 Tax=Culex quinquefasciatus TaxID=7176 RepID=UPI0018E3DBCE|nr:uncharacterized protein LOC6050873 isoform X2 [Culex quinquefasciatus]
MNKNKSQPGNPAKRTLELGGGPRPARPSLPVGLLLLVTLNVNCNWGGALMVRADPSSRTGIDHSAAAPGTAGRGPDEHEQRVHHYGITSSASLPSLGGAGVGGGGTGYSVASGGADKPYFDDVNSRNVTAIVEDTAVLRCRVKHKGDRTVSWMRKRDLHILTSDIHTYTGDQRFSVLHPPDSDDWDLKIEYAQQKDSGIYECQVNTEPKINLAILLDVTEERDYVQASGGKHFIGTNGIAARAKIMGSQEVHVKKGSTISLSCVVNVHASSISWYHGSSVVDFDSVRGGISLETEKNEAGTTSRLLLTRATLRDSGNYTCVPSGAISSSVQVHVLNGEHPAAMQTSSGPPATTCCCPSRYLLLVLLLTLHSSNISKLIHFISTLLEMVRSVLTSVRFKIRRRRRRSRVVPVSRGSNCSVRAAALSCNHPEPSLRPAVLRQQR